MVEEGVEILEHLDGLLGGTKRKRRKLNTELITADFLAEDSLVGPDAENWTMARAKALIEQLGKIQRSPTVNITWGKSGPKPVQLEAMVFCMVYVAMKVHLNYSKQLMSAEAYKKQLLEIEKDHHKLVNAIVTCESLLYKLSLRDSEALEPAQRQALWQQLRTEIIICEHALYFVNEFNLQSLAETYKQKGQFHNAVVNFALASAEKKQLILQTSVP